eukprot:scaffold95733_cov24-Tisochrysis_lutea.AAC.1
MSAWRAAEPRELSARKAARPKAGLHQGSCAPYTQSTSARTWRSTSSKEEAPSGMVAGFMTAGVLVRHPPDEIGQIAHRLWRRVGFAKHAHYVGTVTYLVEEESARLHRKSRAGQHPVPARQIGAPHRRGVDEDERLDELRVSHCQVRADEPANRVAYHMAARVVPPSLFQHHLSRKLLRLLDPHIDRVAEAAVPARARTLRP